MVTPRNGKLAPRLATANGFLTARKAQALFQEAVAPLVADLRANTDLVIEQGRLIMDLHQRLQALESTPSADA